mmetsp:Transcript_13667/g.34334  ORF Transcript_13667/g.34334 Transcript_13667/m.34334 type:complete len:270 (+) Transcript_13667:812-1621(+)
MRRLCRALRWSLRAACASSLAKSAARAAMPAKSPLAACGPSSHSTSRISLLWHSRRMWSKLSSAGCDQPPHALKVSLMKRTMGCTEGESPYSWSWMYDWITCQTAVLSPSTNAARPAGAISTPWVWARQAPSVASRQWISVVMGRTPSSDSQSATASASSTLRTRLACRPAKESARRPYTEAAKTNTHRSTPSCAKTPRASYRSSVLSELSRSARCLGSSLRISSMLWRAFSFTRTALKELAIWSSARFFAMSTARSRIPSRVLCSSNW